MMREPFDEPPAPNRRNFFRGLVTGVAATIAAILGAPLTAFFALPAFRKSDAVWKECGPLENFEVGEIALVPLKPLTRREWPDDWGTESAWVSRVSDQEFVIYSVHCTHVGCPITWNPQARRFFSPCHGGAFDADGRVLAGPPPRPLDRYEVKIEDGVLFAGRVYRVSDQLIRLS